MISRYIAVLCLLCGGLGQAAEFPQFRSLPAGDGQSVALLHGGKILLRWRGAEGSEAISGAAARLNELAFAGLSPQDLTAVPEAVPAKTNGKNGATPAPAVVRARDRLVLRIDHTQAKLSSSMPLGLATMWAQSIGQVFAKPYVVARSTTLQVPVGESRKAEYGGRTNGLPQASVLDAAVAIATVEPVGRSISVTGRAPGTSTVCVRVGESEALIPVVVRKWAARVPSSIPLPVSGRAQDNPWLERAARLAAQIAIEPEPGASATVRDIKVGADGGSVKIAASGVEYFTLERTVPFRMQKVGYPAGDPVRSILSNDPERVEVAQPLFRFPMVAQETIHFLWHHLGGASRTLNLLVRISNSGDSPATVHVTGADGGPSPDEVYVGHIVMQRFQIAGRGQTGLALQIPPRKSVVLSCLPMPPGRVVSGFARLQLLEGAHTFLETEASERVAVPGALSDVSPNMTPDTPTRFLQLPGHKALQLRHEVGRGWGFLHIGKTPQDAVLHPRLKGDYGVVHDVAVTYDNPNGYDAKLELALRSGGGPARAIVEVNGELLETGLLGLGDEHVLFRQRVTGTRTPPVRVRIIPQSGSNYPMTLTARSFAK